MSENPECASTPETPMETNPTTGHTIPWYLKVWTWVQGVLRQVLTGKDNQTHDICRWGIAFALVGIACHDIYQLSHGVNTNVRDLAEAFAFILFGGGAAIAVKRNTEPEG